MKKTKLERIPQRAKALITVATRTVADTLSPEEIARAFLELRQKMRVQDPLNPNLWIVTISGKKLWGILDERAGPEGEDVLTLLFPEDY